MSLIIGLTGGIGSGKSTVAKYFKMLHVEVIDADIVARGVVEKGQPALAEIADHFGSSILQDGELNRSKLRALVFADDSKKKWLNNLLHPLIRAKIFTEIESAEGEYILLEAPLLFENHLDGYCDHVVVVDVEVQTQINRACARDNCTIEQAKSIIASQIERQARLAKASFILDNNALSLSQLETAVNTLDLQLRALQ